MFDRDDSFEELELTSFPAQVIARAIAAPPKSKDPEEYYQKLNKKCLNAIISGKGRWTARFVISSLIKRDLNRFYQFLPLNSLIEWPNSESLDFTLHMLDKVVMNDDYVKVVFPPIPQHLLFIASRPEDQTLCRDLRRWNPQLHLEPGRYHRGHHHR